MAVIDIIPTGPIPISKIIILKWNPAKRNVVNITYTDLVNNVYTSDIPCAYLDGNADSSINLKGSIWINNAGDVNGIAKGSPPLAIGTNDGEHLEIDSNEIVAKSNNP